MPQTISLTLPDLFVDVENPRISEPNQTQRDALRAIAQHQQRKLVALARDILEHGLNPSELPIVMPRHDDRNGYIVLEGNRRIAAAKALENPEPLVGALESGALADLRKLSKEYQTAPIESILCMMVKDRAEADHWLQLRHTGENEGAGLVRWGGAETARFRARSGNVEIHSQALDLLEDRGELTSGQRAKVPITTFKRLLGTPEVRQKIGLSVDKGVLTPVGDIRKVVKALMYVVNDLTAGANPMTVHDVYTREKRIAYAEALPSKVVVPPTQPAGNGTVQSGRTTGKASRAARPVRAKPRDNLIPLECTLKITDPRLRDVENELRTLSLAQYENAVSVLFRVFIELSVDAYIAAKGLHADEKKDSLASKLLRVSADLQHKKKLTSQQAIPVQRACGKDAIFAASVKMMHEYVHNIHVFPAGGDLRAAWNSLQPFITAMWPA
jgi:hypothetical protein